MTARDDFDRHLSAWLAADAPAREPEHLLGEVLAQTARTRRRPAWRIPERWIPMSTITSTGATMSRAPLRTLGAIALLILALVAGLIVYAGAQRPELPAPFGLAANGVLLSVEDGDIVVRDAPDAAGRTLVGGPTEDVGPWPSRDGTRFTWFRINDDKTIDLWTADIDGSGAHRLATGFADPGWIEWAPAGDRLAIGETPVGGDPEIVIVGMDGSRRTLDIGDVSDPRTPMWRPPNGDTLSFTGTDAAGPGLFLVDPDGGEVMRIDVGATLPTQTCCLAEAVWSPDGSRITFHARQGELLQVHVVDIAPDGSVGRDRVLARKSTASDFLPQFLPGGEQILFWRIDGFRHSLRLASVGETIDVIADLQCCKGSFAFEVTPDGSQILIWEATGAPVPVRSIDLSTYEVAATELTTEDIVVHQRVAP
jgi:hypothetical protein